MNEEIFMAMGFKVAGIAVLVCIGVVAIFKV